MHKELIEFWRLWKGPNIHSGFNRCEKFGVVRKPESWQKSHLWSHILASPTSEIKKYFSKLRKALRIATILNVSWLREQRCSILWCPQSRCVFSKRCLAFLRLLLSITGCLLLKGKPEIWIRPSALSNPSLSWKGVDVKGLSFLPRNRLIWSQVMLSLVCIEFAIPRRKWLCCFQLNVFQLAE